ncbi:MAG: NAD-dependent epimerase/dehydratase family protein [Dehalococcoidia bacterium]|nr:NAD-dependent epimerase/dehydratase family protein [Dehalococcoidia bacterium]
MKHVVTGGCGFIGSHLVDRLVELGHEVLVVDDLSTSEGRSVNPEATLIEGSVTDLELLKTATEGADCVFHTAAWARVPRSIDDPVGTHAVNVNGTLNVLQAARENGIGRVVYSSSSSVYGEQDTHVMQEDMEPNPKSPYALHKYIGEQYGAMFARLFGMSVVSLRYFNVYGPGQTTTGAYVLVIPRFLKLRDEGRPLTIYGDGEQTRSYTHVSDVVRANLLAASEELPVGENVVLNVGPNEETSVNEIAAMIGGEVEHIIPNPRGEFEELRKSSDCSRAKSVLGWEPRISLADGIRDIVQE